MRYVSATDVRAMLVDGEELALIDAREELIFSERHLLHARCVPLSRLELNFARLVPRRGTRIVLCDDGESLAERAADVLGQAGYPELVILRGGIVAWAEAGFELFSGVNVPSKAFGEFIEHEDGTPSISADELNGMLRDGADIVVVDSRPFDEYTRVSIPTATSMPGAELVMRIRDVVRSPETTVVVNCAGRTRSIIGAQSLINAGVPNKVVALRNGTMGWSLAGLQCDSGKEKRADKVSDEALAWAQAAAKNVATRFQVPRIDKAMLERWRADQARTLYVFDVRDPAEYEAGHVADALSAPGGQLVQATDHYVGTLGARIVVIDDKEVRAVMTASWLRQMGWDAHVLVAQGTETAPPKPEILNFQRRPEIGVDPPALAAMMTRGEATVVDLSLSRGYLQSHIPSAVFAIRSRLSQRLAQIAIRGTLLLTSEDGLVAELAAAEAQALVETPVRVLVGGNAAWRAAGHPLTADTPKMADEPVDVWLKPYERRSDDTDAMAEYLAWEVDLIPRIARDGSAGFVRFTV